jgi:prepilin-type processing-associated H-X9-DG protein
MDRRAEGQIATKRHRGKAHYIFADTHVARLRIEETWKEGSETGGILNMLPHGTKWRDHHHRPSDVSCMKTGCRTTT